MQVVAVVTAGDSDNLMVGRNGILKDREGRDWDATVVKVVENPISLRQAFWSPYKKLLRFVEEQVNKRAAKAESASHDTLTQGALAVTQAPPAPDAKGAPAEPKKFDVGVVAALGVGVGAITAAVGGLMQSILGLGVWMPFGVLGLLLLISGPSMFIAWFKLRQRNIGPLLDANGWAINARAMLNVPFGRSLTKVAELPPGARLDRADVYRQPRTGGRLVAAILVVAFVALLWHFHILDFSSLLTSPIERK